MAEVEIKLNGKTWKMSSLSVADLKEAEKKAREQYNENTEKLRQKKLAEAQKLGDIKPLELLEYLYKPPTSEEIEDRMFDDIGYLAFLSLKHNHPELTLDEVEKMITVDDLIGLSKAIGKMRGVEDKPTISVDMKTLDYKVTLQDGRTLSISEIIFEANKKKRNRQKMK